MKTLFSPASVDDLIGLLRAWRFWVLASLIGCLAGTLVYIIQPPDYRARATVVVSFNMEKTWPNKPDNELFYYLDRESRKVEEVAWADATLQQVADQTGFPISELRSTGGNLELSHPQDGGWHFYASNSSPELAARLASTWAQAFYDQVQQGVQTAVTLDATRKALAKAPNDLTLQTDIKNLELHSMAITPELQLSLVQGNNLPVERKSGLGSYIIAGTGIFLGLFALIILFTRYPGSSGKGSREVV